MARSPSHLLWLLALPAGCAALPGDGATRGAAADPLATLSAGAPSGDESGESPDRDDATLGGAACDDAACAHEDCAEDACAARAWLEEQGLTIEISVTADAATVVGGGVRQRSTSQALFDVGLFADLDTLAGWEGASLWAEWFTRPGRNLYDDVGDWQGTTWIDVPHGHELYQLWLETWLRPDGLRLKLGKQEGFDEFAVVEAAGEFLNNGPAYSPTLELLPTYPDSAFGAALFGYPSEDVWLSGGVFDGAAAQGENTGKQGAGTLFGDPSDLFLIAEAGRSWVRGESAGAGRGLLGAYKHTGNLARFDGGVQDDA
jgi:carbohydrate-selective porin OprB